LRFRLKKPAERPIENPKSKIPIGLFVLSVQGVATATTAELLELEPVRRVLFILGRHVVALFALRALQNDVISRHIYSN
jgi:hypothetical protein